MRKLKECVIVVEGSWQIKELSQASGVEEGTERKERREELVILGDQIEQLRQG